MLEATNRKADQVFAQLGKLRGGSAPDFDATAVPDEIRRPTLFKMQDKRCSR